MRHNIGLDLNPNCSIHTQIGFLKEFLVNFNYEKKSADDKNIHNYQACKDLMSVASFLYDIFNIKVLIF